MNYNHARAMNFPPNWCCDYITFDDSIRETLSEALTLPRDTDWGKHFNLAKVRQNAFDCDNFYGDNPEWNILNGKLAAVEWLANEKRDEADAVFPELDWIAKEMDKENME